MYVPNDPSYSTRLDKHVDAAEENVTLPLVVLGDAGTHAVAGGHSPWCAVRPPLPPRHTTGIGKSALLANWVQGRKAHMHRDEFLFQHFVSASPHNHRLANLLWRLETALKEHFHLREMEVPETEDRLRWSLGRYLEAASKKALPSHVIIVVLDGLNNLTWEASSHGSLHWLPTELPANVRFIVSTTNGGTDAVVNGSMKEAEAEEEEEEAVQHRSNPGTTTTGSDGDRIYTELCRRRCPSLRLAPLKPEVRQQIIDDFLTKTFPMNQQGQAPRPALCLEKPHRARMVAAEGASCPLVLRVLLCALQVGATLPAPARPSVDTQLDTYLSPHASAATIVAQLLDSSQASIEQNGDGSPRTKGLLGHVLAAVYASRNGLSDEELHGLVELAMGHKGMAPSSLAAIFVLLKEVTVLVNGLRYV